jgi:hypothetical protein
MSRRSIAMFGALVALAIGTAACSGGSKPLTHDEYQQRLTTIGNQANQEAAVVVGALFGSKGDLSKLAPGFDNAGDAIGGYADQLDSLTPPADAADANSKLVQGFNAAETAFHQMADTARAGDQQKLQTEADGLSKGEFAKELQAAGTELKKAGYTLPNAAAQ